MGRRRPIIEERGLPMHTGVLAGCAAALALLLVATPTQPSLASCLSTSPEGVLSCYAEVYSNRDIQALEVLLAEDYVRVIVHRPQAWVAPRESKIESARSLFARRGLTSAVLSFEGDYRVVEGEERDTWRIENITVGFDTREYDGHGEIIGHQIPSCVTLYVRRNVDPNGGYVIFREVFFEGGGCGSD